MNSARVFSTQFSEWQQQAQSLHKTVEGRMIPREFLVHQSKMNQPTPKRGFSQPMNLQAELVIGKHENQSLDSYFMLTQNTLARHLRAGHAAF